LIETTKKLIDDKPEDMKEQMRTDTEDTINRGIKVFFVVQNKTLGNGYGTFKKTMRNI
jgi:Iap family predicted aminopeptidase